MTVYTFKKLMYGDLPEVIQRSVLEFNNDTVIIDDTELTPTQKAKIQGYLTRQGYILQP